MKSEYRRIVAQASEEALASWILKNLDWSGGNDDANSAFLTSILLEHRRQSASAVPESGPKWNGKERRLMRGEPPNQNEGPARMAAWADGVCKTCGAYAHSCKCAHPKSPILDELLGRSGPESR